MMSLNPRQRTFGICLALVAITLALYWPLTHHEFFNVDDPRFIYQNPHVRAGLTWPGVVWAFHTLDTENWQPLTWLSHMLDCQLFGLNAGGHHLVSLLFHLANSLLVFFWLNRLTQTVWRSAFVAALFAWHPLHVESVAWACERKDMLSTFFWLLTLMAYTKYVQSVRAGVDDQLQEKSHPAAYYALTLVLFVFGLMSKPMVVTLPCVLLLLDFWPLNRFGFFGTVGAKPAAQTVVRLIAEKVPFFVLTLAISVATLFAQKAGGALSSLGGMPLSMRLANSLVNYATYLGQTFWPVDLTYFYPFVHYRPLGLVLAAALLLAGVTIFLLRCIRREPWLLIGWLWFVGTLVPTVGLIHVGIQSRADRYMYIPSVGLFILLVWGLGCLFERVPGREKILSAFGGLALVSCLILTHIQLGYWQDSVTLSKHAIAVTQDNYVAYESLGRALYDAGLKDEAFACYQKSVEIEPEFPQSQFNLAFSLREQGRLPEAVERFAAAAKLVPGHAETHSALGSTLLMLPNANLDEAAAQFNEAIRLQPDSIEAQQGLAVALARQGQITNALPHFAEAVRLDPSNAELRFSLGLALMDTHQSAAAAAQFSEEVKLTPNETKAHFRLAQALEQQNQFAEAVAQYQAALRLTPNFPEASTNLVQIFAAHPELKTREPLDNSH